MLPLTLEIISWNESWIATQFMVPNLCIWPTFIKTVFYKSTKATANLRAIGLLLLSHWVTSSSFVTPWTVAHQVFLSMRFPTGLIPGLGSFPEGGTGNALQYSCLEKSHGQRSVEDYSPTCHKETWLNNWACVPPPPKGITCTNKQAHQCCTIAGTMDNGALSHFPTWEEKSESASHSVMADSGTP